MASHEPFRHALQDHPTASVEMSRRAKIAKLLNNKLLHMAFSEYLAKEYDQHPWCLDDVVKFNAAYPDLALACLADRHLVTVQAPFTVTANLQRSDPKSVALGHYHC